MRTRDDTFITLGRWALIRFAVLSDIAAIIAQALKNTLPLLVRRNAAVRNVVLKQVYFTGLEASAVIITIAAILGAVVIAQTVSLVGANGALAGKILVWVVLREMAPLLTALIVIARSGTAIAAELGGMKINGEIESIEMMGIPVDRYLLFPRIAGVSLSIVILTVYFVVCSCLAGFVVVSAGWHVPYELFAGGIRSALGTGEIVALFGKSLMFGVVISATCCSYGMSVGRSVTEIPQAATRAVMSSLILVFVIDGVMTYLASLLLA